MSFLCFQACPLELCLEFIRAIPTSVPARRQPLPFLQRVEKLPKLLDIYLVGQEPADVSQPFDGGVMHCLGVNEGVDLLAHELRPWSIWDLEPGPQLPEPVGATAGSAATGPVIAKDAPRLGAVLGPRPLGSKRAVNALDKWNSFQRTFSDRVLLEDMGVVGQDLGNAALSLDIEAAATERQGHVLCRELAEHRELTSTKRRQRCLVLGEDR